MANQRYIKTYSNYTLKQLHRTTTIGNIYERDFMTISDLNTYVPGSEPTYGLGNFKMAVDNTIGLKKKYRYGNWLKNTDCPDSHYWTTSCLTQDTEDAEVLPPIVNRSQYTSLLDFACYGSAVELVKGGIRGIIKNFPAAIGLTKNVYGVNGYYIASNPFGINVSGGYSAKKPENELRLLSSNIAKYVIEDTKGNTWPISWTKIFDINNPCVKEYDKLSEVSLGKPFYSEDIISDWDVMMEDDKKAILTAIEADEANAQLAWADLPENIRLSILAYKNPNNPNGSELRLINFVFQGENRLAYTGDFAGWTIHPIASEVNAFYRNLDDFQRFLLDKRTNNSVILDTPEETEEGIQTYRKTYTWGKSLDCSWNLDVESQQYKDYVNALLDIATIYDEYYSDNMWRAMTHEAIVKYDWTLTLTSIDGGTEELVAPRSQGIAAYIHTAGRLFDDLKRYIDGIGKSATISFNSANLTPKESLVAILTNWNWDIQGINTNGKSYWMTSPLYSVDSCGYNEEQANNEFYRRLALASRAILSAKGTKRSIEMILALFGYHSYDYTRNSLHTVIRNGNEVILKWNQLSSEEKGNILKNVYDISEYVYVAKEDSSCFTEGYTDVVKGLNQSKLNYDVADSDELQGLPVREVESILADGTVKNYLIPWYDKDKKIDGNVYFESKGGWGAQPVKKTVSIDDNEHIVESNGNFIAYDETVKYLKFYDTIPMLTSISFEDFNINDICYVYDLSDYATYNWGLDTGEIQPTMSHYFILKSDNPFSLGFIKKDGNGNKIYGWKNISEEELTEGTSDDAKRVHYLEGIVESNTGNNPHCGFGQYDDGSAYKTAFKDLFKFARDNDLFMTMNDDEIPKENEIGFNVEKEIDNIKCWYFTDTTSNKRLKSLTENEDGTYTSSDDSIPEVGIGNFLRLDKSRGYDGEEGDLFDNTTYGLMEPVNMEDISNPDDEAAANSIINTKQLYIEFQPDMTAPLSMYDFINNVVMHYVKQVIPATTILKYNVPPTGIDTICYKSTYLQSALI